MSRDWPLEGENFLVGPGKAGVPILILCEHASKAVPDDLQSPEIPPAILDSHWGWDRWAYDTMMRFAAPLGATTVGARVSRLVLDVNRGLDDDDLVRSEADGEPIAINQGLSAAQIEERVLRFHTPYHETANRELGRMVNVHGKERVVFFTFHSFTPRLGTDVRDFDVGVLFDAHEDLAAGVKRALATKGLRVRLNEPYSGYRGQIYSAAVHGEAHDVSYFEIELNQGVLEDAAGRQRIADIFQAVVPAIFPHLPSR